MESDSVLQMGRDEGNWGRGGGGGGGGWRLKESDRRYMRKRKDRK